jgi:hypothetical protein
MQSIAVAGLASSRAQVRPNSSSQGLIARLHSSVESHLPQGHCDSRKCVPIKEFVVAKRSHP